MNEFQIIVSTHAHSEWCCCLI